MESKVPNGGRGEVMLEFAQRARVQGEHFFYVRIPEDIGPEQRGTRYEDALDDALEAHGLGSVTGGGSQLGPGKAIEYCGIDVHVHDPRRGLACIRRVMRERGAPEDTVVEEYLPAYVEHRVWEDAES